MEGREVWRGGPELKYKEDVVTWKPTHPVKRQGAIQQHALILIVLLFSHVLLYSILYVGFSLFTVFFPFHITHISHTPRPWNFGGNLAPSLVTCTLTGMLWAQKKKNLSPLDCWLFRRILFLFACIGVKGAFENSSEQVWHHVFALSLSPADGALSAIFDTSTILPSLSERLLLQSEMSHKGETGPQNSFGTSAATWQWLMKGPMVAKTSEVLLLCQGPNV